MSTEVKKEPSTYGTWYERNKAALSERRRKKYQTDEDYRQNVISRQREYRSNNPPPSRAGKSNYRLVAGNKVEVFRIGRVGEIIGRTDQTIRDWEASGLIPKPSVESAHRYYTKKQVQMLKELADLITLLRSEGRKDLDEVVSVKSSEIHNNWQ